MDPISTEGRPAPPEAPRNALPIVALSLDDLRAAVLRRRDQLHRPSDPRTPEADAARSVCVERGRLRSHRLRLHARVRNRRDLPGRVMDVLGTRRGYGVAVSVWSLAAAAYGLV